MANETNIIQKSAYLRGLADGMKLSANSDDTSKLLLAMIDCIDSIAVQVNDNTDLICELDDEVDSCSDSLDAFAELVFGIDDDDDEIDINDDDDLFACDDDDDDSKCFGCSCPAESAVRSAVSARPLRAPWELMKNSRTERPSRKFARIGTSMICPRGSAMRPRIPRCGKV